MEIQEKLKQEKSARLRQLARQLKIEGRSKLKTKQDLINHIANNYTEQEIYIALDVNVSWWKRIKDYTHF